MAIELLKYDSHNHSSFSDGHDSPEEIARVAATRVDMASLTDHNTVLGIQPFLTEVKRLNDMGQPLIPVPGVEVSLTIGHMLLLVPDLSLTDKFLKWASSFDLEHTPAEQTILPGVREFNGVCVFAHPQVAFTSGAKLDDLTRLVDRLPTDIHPHLAVEAVNNVARVIPGYSRSQDELREWNLQYGLSEMAGSDGHTKYSTGKAYCLVPEDLGLSAAVEQRQVKAGETRFDLRDWLTVFVSQGGAYLKHKTEVDLYPQTRAVLQTIDRFSS